MTEAELIEMINKKRNELEENRSGNARSELLKTLEGEIKELESGLSRSDTKQVEEQVFLDECAG